MENKTNPTKCKDCGSLLNYIRIKSNVRVCRTCGFIEDLKIKGGKHETNKKP